MNILLHTDTHVNIGMWPFVWRAVVLQTFMGNKIMFAQMFVNNEYKQGHEEGT